MTQKPSNLRCAELQIAGMTCRSCELLLERKLKALPGIVEVDVHYRTGKARIIADTTRLPSPEAIEKIIEHAGYRMASDDAPTIADVEPPARKWMEIGAALLIVLALGKLLQTFDLVSLAPSTSGALTLGGTLLIGLVAGTSSCLAVTGGLLLSMAAKHTERHGGETAWQKLRPLLHFNAGRIVSYVLLGGAIGLLGQAITLGTKLTGYMNIAIALVMLYLALSILHIIPKGSCPIRPPKRLSRWIAGLSEHDHPAAPFALGALTFFLPCGFTQSLQIAALASGSFVSGALTMGAFALGTLPSLLGLSAVSATAKGTVQRLFLRFSGALVLILALFNLQSGLALTGVDPSQVISAALGNNNAGVAAPRPTGGVQELSMRVGPSSYEPSQLTVYAGIPVRWTIDGTEARGCTSVLVIPSLNIVKPLQSGINIVEFTPPAPGQLAFSCSMGMVRGTITVL